MVIGSGPPLASSALQCAGAGALRQTAAPTRQTRTPRNVTVARRFAIRNSWELLARSRFLGQLLLVLLDHLFLFLLRNRGVLGKFHRVLAFALRGGAQIRRVAEHAVQRDLGRDGDVLVALGFEDDAATLVHLTDDGA